MSEKQEIALMRRLAAGDQQAFTVLYEQYRGVSYSFVLSLVKDSSISKDIVHDVFVKLWLKRESLAKVLSFNRYLYQMLKNAVYDHFSAMQVSRHYIDELTNLFRHHPVRHLYERASDAHIRGREPYAGETPRSVQDEPLPERGE